MRFAAFVLLLAVALPRPVLADFQGLLGAARARNLDAVRTLLEQGADPNPPYAGYNGYTPLMFSAGNGDPVMTQLLLQAGAETERRDHNNERALQWAAGQSYMNHYTDTAEAARLLLEAGSPADSDEDGHGTSPLIAVNRFGSDPVMTRHLIAAGADVNRRNRSGESPLYTASGSRSGEEAVRLLIEAGAEPDVRVDHLGETPLHRAAAHAGPETIRLLVEAGAGIEARRNGGETALFVAAGRGHADSVAMLLSLGAEVDATDDRGLTPILAAITGRYAPGGSRDAAALRLAGSTADVDRAFAAAVWQDMSGVAQGLLQRGADVDAVDHLGRSALAGAAALSSPRWFDRLLDRGADLARHGADAMGEAAGAGFQARLVRLLRLGVAVDARDGGGATPLMRAAVRGRLGAVSLLALHDADAAATDGRGHGIAQQMAAARAQLEEIVARADMSAALIDVSNERRELARLRLAHADIALLLGL